MPRIPYSLNSYTGGAIPATLFYSVTATGTAITITGTNTTWSGLGVNGGFNLAINYGGVNEEKVFVPSGTYPWTSGGVTLSGITRGYDNTTPYLQVAGISVVPVLTAIETAEANQLVNVVLANLNTSTSGQLLTSTGSGIAFTPNLLSTPKSLLTNPILNGTMETIYPVVAGASGIMTVNVTSGSTYFYTAPASGSFGINLTASGNFNGLVGVGQSFTASVLVTQAASGYPPVSSGMQIDGQVLVPSGSFTNLYWYGSTAPSSGYPNGIDAYTFNAINVGSIAISGSYSGINGIQNVFVGSGAPFGYTSNLSSNSTSVFSTTTNAVVAILSGTNFVGDRWVVAGNTPNGYFAYTSNQSSNSVAVISGTTFITLLSGVTTGFNSPYLSTITPSANAVYIPNPTANSISLINTTSNTVTNIISGTAFGLNSPYSVTAHPYNNNIVYASNYGNNTISVLSGTSLVTIISGASFGFNQPYSLAIANTSNGVYAYVNNLTGNTVSVFNTATNTAVTVITGASTGFNVNSIAQANPNNNFIYISNNTGNSVSVINTTSNTVTAIISGINNPMTGAYGMSSNTSGSILYVAANNTVTLINTTTNSGTALAPGFTVLASQTRY
jgi:YVTN family beta-propeller protein